jgi:IS5 family transposase
VRVVQSQQLSIGEIDVSKIKFDPKSRDDIPKILRGLQHLYMDPALRASIFELLARQVAPRVNKHNGRPGMTLWTILVCGVIRLDLNIDYDRLHELVNHHNTIREMLGHGAFEDVSYHHQTLKDNVSLLTPELLDEINQLVVQAGHGLIKKKGEEGALRGRCDSFVVETNVHYPTDINLSSPSPRNGARTVESATGANTPTTPGRSSASCERRRTRSAHGRSRQTNKRTTPDSSSKPIKSISIQRSAI